ncbi:MAG: (2Fe-2S)-binding protein [Pirellulaceae bacterium]
MNLDDELCLCFHVSRRKVINYIRIHQPQKASQLSNCFGAGTGCGWCRPFLERLLQQHQNGEPIITDDKELPDPQSYASGRTEHRRRKGLEE